MPVVPNFVERTIFLSLNQGPGPVLDIWNAVAFRAGWPRSAWMCSRRWRPAP